jgi:hypothetical protein
VEKWPEFLETVQLFSTHGVVVAAHASELVSLLWLPPFTALIEFMPYKAHSLKYSSLAAMVGVARYPVHPRPDVAHDQVTYSQRNGVVHDIPTLVMLQCANEPQALVDAGCGNVPAKNLDDDSSPCAAVVAKLRAVPHPFEFETALVNAVVHVGGRLALRGVEPVRNESTITGWQ